MQKIGFNNHYGLQDAVFERRKEMTRREPIEYDGDIVTEIRDGRMYVFTDTDHPELLHKSRYAIGEVVAIAQSYEDILAETDIRGAKELDEWFDKIEQAHNGKDYCLLDGTDNKMFVKAELMPHHIRITDIKVERLQDISDEDCINEGIITDFRLQSMSTKYYIPNQPTVDFIEPREAFAALIDKVSGKGTWESNPYVIVYSFEIVD